MRVTAQQGHLTANYAEFMRSYGPVHFVAAHHLSRFIGHLLFHLRIPGQGLI